MKRIALLVTLAVAGCRGSGSRTEPVDTRPTDTTGNRINDLRAQRASKEAELRQIDTEIAEVDRDMQSESAKPASAEKSERMASLASAQKEKQQAKASVERDMKAIDDELAQLGAGTPAPAERRDAKHIDPDALLKEMEEAGKEQQDAEKRMAAAIAEQDAKKIEDANREKSAKKASMDADAKAIAGSGITAGADLTYEERCAGVLARVKAELEKFRK